MDRCTVADEWAPVVSCPTSYVDLLRNTTWPKSSARFPRITIRDTGSRISTVYEPPNGTIVNIGESVKVIVTAFDESGNSAQCVFWYTAEGSPLLIS